MSRRHESADWYDEPLLYDVAFASETEVEAKFIEAVCDEHGRSRGRTALEPACGSGRLLEALARRDRPVIGFDANEAMVRFARRRLAPFGRRAQVRPGRMESFTLSRPVALAYNLVSTFRYLPTEAAAQAHLRCVRDALAPGGIYLLGLLLSEYGTHRCSRERWVGRRGTLEVVCNTQSWPPDRRRRRERFRARLRATDGNGVRRLESCWTFRTYDAAQLRRTLRSVAGLSHVATYDFDCDVDAPRSLDDDQLDCIVVLWRERGR